MTERSYRWLAAYKIGANGRLGPTLPVRFVYAQATRPYDGLVDSGAERTVCSEAIAREAGIEIERFPELRVRGIGGVTRDRRCPIDLLIYGVRIDTEVLVVSSHHIVLGRHDVFNAFQFGFDERAKLLLIEPYGDAP